MNHFEDKRERERDRGEERGDGRGRREEERERGGQRERVGTVCTYLLREEERERGRERESGEEEERRIEGSIRREGGADDGERKSFALSEVINLLTLTYLDTYGTSVGCKVGKSSSTTGKTYLLPNGYRHLSTCPSSVCGRKCCDEECEE